MTLWVIDHTQPEIYCSGDFLTTVPERKKQLKPEAYVPIYVRCI